MRVLSVDSSTATASCAVIEEGKLLGEVSFNDKKQHSVILMPQIDYLLKNLNLDIDDIDGFVVSSGPGSFTGLRIGTASIKGLAQGLDKPLIGISSLDCLAYNLAYTDGIICPILDALRDNVYTALYKFAEGNLMRLTDYMAIHIDELISIIQGQEDNKVCFIGDGISKFKEKLENSFKYVYFSPAHLNLPRASSLGELGLQKLKNSNGDDLLSFSPIYLRKSQAEREYEDKARMSVNE
jgi:tRNA threonylcarbamoyl adenosine modification protein YeaZ